MVLKSQIMMVNQSIQAIIQYKSTHFGIINLMTVITAVKENSYFIDEQRFGPHMLYKPFFLKLLKRCKMTDVVHYALPFRSRNE
jgi:hypothetical protein